MSLRTAIIFLFSLICVVVCQMPRFVPNEPILRFLQRVEVDPQLLFAEQISEDKRYSANDLNDILRRTWLG